MKRNWKDILTRALKTFWQTGVAFLLVRLSEVSEAVTAGDFGEMLLPVIVGAVAAGLSAAWNGVISPMLKNTDECEDTDLIYVKNESGEFVSVKLTEIFKQKEKEEALYREPDAGEEDEPEAGEDMEQEGIENNHAE